MMDSSQFISQIKQEHDALRETLLAMSEIQHPPTSRKSMRKLSAAQAASYIGISVRYLANVVEEIGLTVEQTGTHGRRQYSIEEITEVRRFLALKAGSDTKKKLFYDPRRREGEELQILACANFKGGSGKSTTAVHLAQYLALRGYRILFIDLDPQGSASSVFDVQPEHVGDEESLYAALRYDDPKPISSVIQKTYFGNIDLIPGGPWLSEWEFDAPRVANDAKYESTNLQHREHELREELKVSGITNDRTKQIEEEIQSIESRTLELVLERLYFLRFQLSLGEIEDEYDIVICDTSPNLGYLTNAAIFAATQLIVTIYPQQLDCESMVQYLATIFSQTEQIERAVRSELGDDYLQPKKLHYLITRFDQQSAPEREIATMLRAQLHRSMLTNPMVKSSAIAEAGTYQRTLYEAERSSFNTKTYDRAVDAMNLVNSEIEDLLKSVWGRA